jgi:hypothetical protein
MDGWSGTTFQNLAAQIPSPMNLLPRLALIAALFVASSLSASGADPLKIDGLVSYWDFHEAAGEDRVALGPGKYHLQEMGGPIERVTGGPFGEHAVRLKSRQWFRIARGDFPALDFHGPEARLTVVAWVKRESTSAWQAIAGVWNETQGQRQYCLFLNAASRSDARTMTRQPCRDLVHGHVSDVGTSTAGQKFCITYSSSPQPVPVGEWQMVAMTYDGQASRAYVGGRFQADEGRNPFPLPGGLFHGTAEFTVGAVDRGGSMGNFFAGTLGGLAIYSRALSEEELQELALPKNGQSAR